MALPPMTVLPNTPDNQALVQNFIDETHKRIDSGAVIRTSLKAQTELRALEVVHDITQADIKEAILRLTVENYYRGIDPSGKKDFDVCAFRVTLGENQVEVYIKYGLERNGLQIYMFSNHEPDYPMSQPFKK